MKPKSKIYPAKFTSTTPPSITLFQNSLSTAHNRLTAVAALWQLINDKTAVSIEKQGLKLDVTLFPFFAKNLDETVSKLHRYKQIVLAVLKGFYEDGRCVLLAHVTEEDELYMMAFPFDISAGLKNMTVPDELTWDTVLVLKEGPLEDKEDVDQWAELLQPGRVGEQKLVVLHYGQQVARNITDRAGEHIATVTSCELPAPRQGGGVMAMVRDAMTAS